MRLPEVSVKRPARFYPESRFSRAVSLWLELAVLFSLSLGIPLEAATFDSTSATINNKFYPLKVGAKYTYTGTGENSGYTISSKATAIEAVDGIACIKVISDDLDGELVEWYAQDTEGAVWTLRQYDAYYEEYDEEDYLTMPANPQVGDLNLLWILEYEVVSTAAQAAVPAKNYTGCLHLQCVDDAWPDEQEYYAPNVGLIKLWDSLGGWELKSATGLAKAGSGGSSGSGGTDGPVGAAKLGTYDGYLYRADTFGGGAATAVRGTLALKVSSLTGKLTAKVTLQNAALSFSSSGWTSVDDADGTCRATLTAKGGETLDLAISENRMWGTLAGGTLGSEAFTLEGARSRFADRTDAEAQGLLSRFLGYYTVALPVNRALSLGAANAAPQGVGFLTVTVGSGGSAKIAGVLADGTKVSQSSRLIAADGEGPEACVPLFVPLYSKAGWAGGLLWIDPASRVAATDRSRDWFVRWEKPGAGPDGFSALLDADGGFYGTAAALAAHYRFSAEAGGVGYYTGAGFVGAAAGALPAGTAVESAGGKLVMPKGVKPELSGGAYGYSGANSALATLSFAPGTGLFKGAFNLYYDYVQNGKLTHKAVGVPYAGVLTPVRAAAFAGRPAGQGHCLVPDSDPAVKSYRLKRSFPVRLEAE